MTVEKEALQSSRQITRAISTATSFLQIQLTNKKNSPAPQHFSRLTDILTEDCGSGTIAFARAAHTAGLR
jgi:hypothetical protein